MVTPPNLLPGTEVLANLGHNEWHARIVVEWVGGDLDATDSCVIVTPDYDF